MKRKIINDPVFGFITIPDEFLFDIIQHPYFQRLSRIKQLGLSSFVYPGAQHTRFLHSLGAMYLMGEAITQLRQVGQEITPEEEEAAKVAILLHDIGHGPFSHALENTLITNVGHEHISLMMMTKINDDFNGKLDLAIQIFTNNYPKHFLHQLVSSQLDVDRLDYLSRDSFFCGVSEGIIGASRILKMLTIHEGMLAIEAKGIYSIEKFLVARRLMYWQVYLHKTSIAAEKMLTNILKRAKELAMSGDKLFAPQPLQFFLYQNISKDEFETDENVLKNFAMLDDSDIFSSIKMWSMHSDVVLSTLCNNFINRKLFKVEVLTDEQSGKQLQRKLIEKIKTHFGISTHEAGFFIGEDTVSTDTYSSNDEHINILYKNGDIKDISDASDMLNIEVLTRKAEKHYLSYFRL